jgi:uncharacterized membrane protein
VYDEWHQLPAGHRPKLVVFGESLGSFGGEAAFSGTEDIRDRTSGVFWVGSTNTNTLWSRFTAGRVAADLALATAVPAGHGHSYGML